MLNFAKLERFTIPKPSLSMTAAFDKACHLLSTRVSDDENTRQILAWQSCARTTRESATRSGSVNSHLESW